MTQQVITHAPGTGALFILSLQQTLAGSQGLRAKHKSQDCRYCAFLDWRKDGVGVGLTPLPAACLSSTEIEQAPTWAIRVSRKAPRIRKMKWDVERVLDSFGSVV